MTNEQIRKSMYALKNNHRGLTVTNVALEDAIEYKKTHFAAGISITTILKAAAKNVTLLSKDTIYAIEKVFDVVNKPTEQVPLVYMVLDTITETLKKEYEEIITASKAYYNRETVRHTLGDDMWARTLDDEMDSVLSLLGVETYKSWIDLVDSIYEILLERL